MFPSKSPFVRWCGDAKHFSSIRRLLLKYVMVSAYICDKASNTDRCVMLQQTLHKIYLRSQLTY